LPSPLQSGVHNTLICAQSSSDVTRAATEHIETSLRQGVRLIFFVVRGAAFLAGVCGRDRRVGAGPGVAWPKSRRSGCEPAALATESFPSCPPGPLAVTARAARAAPAFRCLKISSLTWRLRARSASLAVLPSATFLS